MFGVVEGTGFEVLDERFKSCFVGHARVERLWTGGRWLEGPAWFAASRYLVFSDIPNNRMLRYDDLTGNVSPFRTDSRNANGNSVDCQGRLVTCEQMTRRVTRTNFDGTLEVLADSFQGMKLNAPNDIVVQSDGTVWFTDPTYGIMNDYEGVAAQSEIGRCNVYRIATDGAVSAVGTDFVMPNGLAFAPDESVLYVADSGASHVSGGPRHIRRMHVTPSGSLESRGIFAECTQGMFDGIRVDAYGRVWTSARDGVHCYDPDGTLIGKIRIPEPVSNLEFGGEKRNRLFITATSSLYSIYLTVRGSRAV